MPSLPQSSCRTNVWHRSETRSSSSLRLVHQSACSSRVKTRMLRSTKTRSCRHHLGIHLKDCNGCPPDDGGFGGPDYHYRPLNLHGQGMTVGATSFIYPPGRPMPDSPLLMERKGKCSRLSSGSLHRRGRHDISQERSHEPGVEARTTTERHWGQDGEH